MSTPLVQFRTCQLFKETFEKYRSKVGSKLTEFLKTKAADPMTRFGSKDQHFTGNGPLGMSGLIHAHLDHNISVLYKKSGRNPTVIDLYAVVSHDDIGTGHPQRPNLQKSIVKSADRQDMTPMTRPNQ